MGAGADLIGFNFSSQSARCVTVDKVESILRSAPKGFSRVGVFQNMPADEVTAIAKRLGLHFLQLHGDENPDDYREASVPIIKAFHVATPADVQRAGQSTADYILFDTPSVTGGGGGQTFDWSLLKDFSRPYFVAGGLNPGNVGQVIKELRPYGVDVTSGVESSPGKKSQPLLKAFLNEARSAEGHIFSDLRGR